MNSCSYPESWVQKWTGESPTVTSSIAPRVRGGWPIDGPLFATATRDKGQCLKDQDTESLAVFCDEQVGKKLTRTVIIITHLSFSRPVEEERKGGDPVALGRQYFHRGPWLLFW